MQGTQSKRTLALWLMGFALVAFGAKLWTIQLWATDLPFWDQWSEAQHLFQPWLAGHLDWGEFPRPHNEHRILFTRMLDLLEVMMNGQWDPVFQMVVNAVIHIAFGAALATVLWNLFDRKYAGLICCFLLPLFALPFAAENTIRGFQSQMYLVNIFSVTAILALGFGRPGGGIWFCGLAFAFMAIFTLASGFLAAATVAGLVVFRWLKRRTLTRGEGATLLSALALTVLGLALQVTVPGDEGYRAKSIGQFISALLRCLAWPYISQPTLAVLVCLPLGALLIAHLRPGFKNLRAAEFVLAFALFVILQCLVLAYGRALTITSSRYQDSLCLLPVAAFAAFVLLNGNLDPRRWPRFLLSLLAVGWMVALVQGVNKISHHPAEAYLYDARKTGIEEVENTRAFIATDDPGWMKSKTSFATPYPTPGLLLEVLREPKNLAIMPADARPALPLEADPARSAGFYTNGCPPEHPGEPFVNTWGTYLSNAAPAAAHFVSRPMTSGLPKLSVQVFRGAAPAQFKLIGADHREIELKPLRSDRWQTLVVDAPASPFVLSVNAPVAGALAAVGEIKELGRWSVLAQKVVRHALLILSIGLCFCLALGLAALFEPGVSPAYDRLVWLLILPALVAALVGTEHRRHFDPVDYSNGLRQSIAADLAASGHPGLASLYLREVLWLRPETATARTALEVLDAHGDDEPLPGNLP